MITMRDYAEIHHVSYEAVRAQVARNREQLEPHISINNRTIFLDEWAVEFLNERRRMSPVTVLNDNREAEIAALKDQVEQMKATIAKLQDEKFQTIQQLMDMKDREQAYLEDKVKHKLILEEYKQNKAQLTDAVTRAAVAESRVEDVRARLDDAKAEAARLLEERNAAVQESQSYRRTWFGLYRKG